MEANLIIELGGAYVTVYKKNSGLILKQPSMIAVASKDDVYEIKGYGENASTLASIEDENINVFSPFSAGKIKSFEYAQILLELLFKEINLDKKVGKHKAIILTNLGFDEADKAEYEKLLKTISVKPTHFIPSIVGLAFYDGFDVYTSPTVALCDIGDTASNVCVFASSGIAYGSSIGLGGRSMSLGVINLIAKKYSLQISMYAAKRVKEELANLTSYDTSTIDVKGIDISSNQERVATIKASDVRECLEPYFKEILKQIEYMLNMSSDKELKQIKMTGLTLGGQVCKTIGIERYFKENLQIPVKISEDVEDSNILGIGKIMKNKELLNRFSFKG